MSEEKVINLYEFKDKNKEEHRFEFTMGFSRVGDRTWIMYDEELLEQKNIPDVLYCLESATALMSKLILKETIKIDQELRNETPNKRKSLTKKISLSPSEWAAIASFFAWLMLFFLLGVHIFIA